MLLRRILEGLPPYVLTDVSLLVNPRDGFPVEILPEVGTELDSEDSVGEEELSVSEGVIPLRPQASNRLLVRVERQPVRTEQLDLEDDCGLARLLEKRIPS